jgi:hypothetical protein
MSWLEPVGYDFYMNPGVAAGVVLIVVGVVGAVIGQFLVRNDNDRRSAGLRSYMLLLVTIVEVASLVVAAIVVAQAKHTISIVVAAAWLAAWTYVAGAEWRRFLRDRTGRW